MTTRGETVMAIDETQERYYNARAAVPDHRDYFDCWTARSADLRARTDCRLDIPYGDNAGERLDLFAAAAPGGPAAPLLMFIHGGYWQGLDKSMFSFVTESLIEAGIAVAVVGYDLCPAVTIEHIAGEIRRAACFLEHNAADLGFDGGRLYVSGHSAGGHLTAMVMADGGAANPKIRGGAAISGLFDLAPLIKTSINEKLGLDGESARRNSPLYMDPAGDAPLLLAVGGEESAGFHDQSDRLAAAWGDRCRRLVIAGRHHFSVVESLAEADGVLCQAVKAMILN